MMRVREGRGRSYAASAWRPSLRERAADLLLVGTPVDVRYLTGFTGSTAWP